MTVLQDLFGKRKVVIAMAHFPPLPGQPLHPIGSDVRDLLHAVQRDVEILAVSGVDGLLFCNEGDRPYRTKVGPETAAAMAAVITEVARDLPVTFGVDVLWDPIAAIAVAMATRARFVREVFTGAYAGDFGIWNTDPATTLSYRRQIGAEGIRLFFNVNAEFAAPIAPRDPALQARSAVFSSLADAVCISGVITGTGVDVEQLRRTKDAVAETPVIANTGVRAETVRETLSVADGCIVGTALKRDGVTWNPVDAERVARFVDAAACSGHWEPTRTREVVS